jgi:hypothetical protein
MMTLVATPDWLSKHGGSMRQCTTGRQWLVLLDNQPMYRIVPIPAAGKYSCELTEIVNGRRLDSGSSYPTDEAALHGGLEDLRKRLGW